MNQVYTIGETTFDILFKESKPFDAKVGGSVVNTAVSLGRLGVPVNMIAACGNDEIGKMTSEFLKSNGVNTSSLTIYEGTSRVALAFLDSGNNAKYSFYNGQNLEKKGLLFPETVKDSIVLFASTFAIKPDIRNDLKCFLLKARDKGAMIYYDPNVRPSHFTSNINAKDLIIDNICLSSIVKGSDEDFNLLFGSKSPQEAYDSISSINKKAILLITCGQKGAWLFTPELSFLTQAPKIEPVSTIGAGDTFSAGILYALSKAGINTNNLPEVKEDRWREYAEIAIRFATQVCMSYDNYIERPSFD